MHPIKLAIKKLLLPRTAASRLNSLMNSQPPAWFYMFNYLSTEFSNVINTTKLPLGSRISIATKYVYCFAFIQHLNAMKENK